MKNQPRSEKEMHVLNIQKRIGERALSCDSFCPRGIRYHLAPARGQRSTPQMWQKVSCSKTSQKKSRNASKNGLKIGSIKSVFRTSVDLLLENQIGESGVNGECLVLYTRHSATSRIVLVTC